MIRANRLLFLVVWLAIGLLVACEPLAPDQTPQYIIVTGETPVSTPVTPALLNGASEPDADGMPGTPSPDSANPGDQLAPAAAAMDATSTTDSAGNAGAPVPSATTSAGGVVNTPVPSITPTPPPTALPSATPYACDQARGRVVQSSFASAIVGDQVAYRMYQPPCFYETLQRYPYVLLLHGTGYDDAMWQDLGVVDVLDMGIADGILPPMVLIMPDGGALSELNNQSGDASYEAVLLNELLPVLERDFCLWGSRQGRAIGGISRGGFWAFSIGLRHPEMFSAIGGHSPHFEEDNALPEYNPLSLASRVNLDAYPQRIYLDNAASDYVSANTLRISEILRENGIDHEYLIDPVGDHTEEYWAAHVPAYLQFYGQAWPLDPLALPSCLAPSP